MDGDEDVSSSLVGPEEMSSETHSKHAREVIRRAAVEKGALRVATPEDLVVMKLIADRPKDRVDLAGLARLPRLDRRYVERWAREWQVLEKARALRAQVES